MHCNAQSLFPAGPTPDNDDNIGTATGAKTTSIELSQDLSATIVTGDNSRPSEASKHPANIGKSTEMADENVHSQQPVVETAPIEHPSETTVNGGKSHSSNTAGVLADIEESHEMAIDEVQSQQNNNSINSKITSAGETEDVHMDDAQATRSDDTTDFEAPKADAATNDTADDAQATRSDDATDFEAPKTDQLSTAAMNDTPDDVQATRSDDVTIKIPTAQSSTTATNDTPAPSWLGKMLVYLRGVSDMAEWQDLVSSLLEFESMDPPSGVGVCSLIFHMSFIQHYFLSRNSPPSIVRRKSEPG